MTHPLAPRPQASWRGSPPAKLVSTAVIGGTFGVVALALAVTTQTFSLKLAITTVLLIGVYAIAYRTDYVHPEGGTVPTEPVLVAMLFLLPLHLVPVVVLVAQLPYGLLRNSTGLVVGREFFLRLISSWHCVGPVLVLMIAKPGQPDLGDWPIYLLALLSQFVFDLVPTLIREYAYGFDLRELVTPMAWTLGIDTLLACIGLCAVIAAGGSMTAILLVSVPIGLFALLRLDRHQLAENKEHLGHEVAAAREEARIDPMTGLGNRRAWYEAVESAQALLEAPGSQIAVGVIAADLNNLKFANDVKGHEIGDELIKAMSEVADTVAPDGAVVCRIGGDEFAFLLAAPADELDIDRVAERLRASIAARGDVCGVQLSAGIGTARCPPAASVVDAMRVADHAVISDKRKQRSSRVHAQRMSGGAMVGDRPTPGVRWTSRD